MFKMREQFANSIVRSYRVESNHGSKYFADESEAMAYYEYMQARKRDAELWLVSLYYDEDGELVKGSQMLLIAESDEGMVDFT